jgi:hypothetical protein
LDGLAKVNCSTTNVMAWRIDTLWARWDLAMEYLPEDDDDEEDEEEKKGEDRVAEEDAGAGGE